MYFQTVPGQGRKVILLLGSGSRESGRRCQGMAGAAGELAQVTKDGQPWDSVGFVGNDLSIRFYLIKLERSSQNVSV